MKMDAILFRKCSPALLAATGAAMCITGGGPARATTGTIKASNAGQSVFSSGDKPYGFGGIARWFLWTSGGRAYFSERPATGRPFLNGTLTNGQCDLVFHPAGVVVSAGLAHGFNDIRFLVPNVSDKYIAVNFRVGVDERYGWVHVISTNASATQITMDKWGYNATGGSIETLDASVAVKKLALSDGQVKLCWSNANEQGVARYVVEVQRDGGAWSEVDSSAPGAGNYAAKVEEGATCRLAIERVDGATEHLAF